MAASFSAVACGEAGEAGETDVATFGLDGGGDCGLGAASFSPGSALSASVGSAGPSGEHPEPLPAAPPELIITMVPLMKIPAGLMLMKLPPTLSVRLAPDSITTLIPALR